MAFNIRTSKPLAENKCLIVQHYILSKIQHIQILSFKTEYKDSPNIKVPTPDQGFIIWTFHKFKHTCIPRSSSWESILLIFPTIVWNICVEQSKRVKLRQNNSSVWFVLQFASICRQNNIKILPGVLKT